MKFRKIIFYLYVATTAVNVLFMLDGKLNDQSLLVVGKGGESGRKRIVACILAGLDAYINVI